ncbi:MAG: tetratricopeptide repeat protein, partial [Gemmataceae bacterium]
GAILCEILTGTPAFHGGNARELMTKAAQGELQDACERLDSCGVDQELVTLTKRCLAPEREDRPRDGAEVATIVEIYEQRVQERLRQAELERTAAQVKAAEEAQRLQVEKAKRRLTVMLAAVGMMLLLGVGGATLWYQDYLKRTEIARQKDYYKSKEDGQQLRTVLDAIDKVHIEFDGKLKQKNGVFHLHNRRRDWTAKLQEARDTLSKRGHELLARIAGTEADELKNRLNKLQIELEEDIRDWELAAKLGEIRERRMILVNNHLDSQFALEAYPQIFQKAGLSLLENDRDELAIQIRSMRIDDQIIDSLYDWVNVTYLFEPKAKEPKERSEIRKLRRELFALLALVDDNRWAKRLHDMVERDKLREDQEYLRQFIDKMPRVTSPALVVFIGQFAAGDTPAQRSWLNIVRARYETDFILNFEIATQLTLRYQYQEAIGYYRAAVNINPEGTIAYLNWAVALNHLGMCSEAILKLQKVLELDPKNPVVHVNWGEALYMLNRYEEAIAKARKALTLDPAEAGGYAAWGAALDGLKKPHEAIIKFEKAASIDPDATNTYVNWGITLGKLGKYQEAILKFEKAVNLDTKEHKSYLNWGIALDRLGRYDEAISKYKQALDVKTDARTYVNWGLTLDNLGKPEEAIAKFKKAVTLDPDDANAYALWGGALLGLDKAEEAIVKLKRATELDPKNAVAQALWGTALTDLNKPRAALSKFEKAKQLEPTNPVITVDMARPLQLLGDYEAVINLFEKEAERRSRADHTHYRQWGSCLVKLKKYAEAVTKFEKAASLNPKDATVYTNWGITLQHLKKDRESLSVLQKAIDLDPNYTHPHLAMGDGLATLGKFREAIHWYQTAKDLLPKSHPYHARSERLISKAKHYLHLEKQLSDVLAKNQKVSFAVQLQLAFLCQGYKKRYRDAVKLYFDIFERNPNIANNLKKRDRYNAACAASMAAALQGVEAKQIDAKERTKLRQQALGWLRSDLAMYSQQWREGPTSLFATETVLEQWVRDSDLSHVRNKKAIGQFPQDEKQDWRALWSNVKAIQKKIRASYTKTVSQGKLSYRSPQKFDCAYHDHKLQLRAGREYTIELQSLAFDGFLIVLDPSGSRRIAENDDIIPGTNHDARVHFRVPKTGVYVVRVTTAQSRQLGSYALHVFDHGPVKVINDKLTTKQAAKIHILQVTAGRTYGVEMHSKEFDTLLRLEDARGKLLAENDDINAQTNNLNSRVTYTAEKTGNLKIVATSYELQGRGRYQLIVREFSKPSN